MRVISQAHKDSISKKLTGRKSSKKEFERKSYAQKLRWAEYHRLHPKKVKERLPRETWPERHLRKKIEHQRLWFMRNEIILNKIDILWLDRKLVCRKCEGIVRLGSRLMITKFLDKVEPFIENHKYC